MVKCPKCGREVEEWAGKCPYCKTNFEKYNRGETSNRNHAYWLNIFAIINIVLCIIASIVIFINFSTSEIVTDYSYISGSTTEAVTNWVGIIGGISVLILGLTQYFILETIIDIYDMVEETNNNQK